MADVAVKAVFRVIDAFDHPHDGRILRLRLQGGQAPSLKELRAGTFLATSEAGDEIPLDVAGFAVFGGKPTDRRLARTGRIDVHVAGESADEIGPGWRVSGPA